MSAQLRLTPAKELAGKNGIRFPNASSEYRIARDSLLAEEIELRRHIKRVAEQRRALPAGGEVRQVAHHFCAHRACATFSDSPAFEPDGKWDGTTRRIGVNARLMDAFDAALAPLFIIDGKHL